MFLTKIAQIFRKRPQKEPVELKERIVNYNDSELVRILKQRTYYTDEAVEIAVKEAMRRGMINSEQDLFDEKFRVEKLSFSWFPLPSNEAAVLKLQKSIARSLLFCGVIPIVFGFLEINTGNVLNGKIILAVGFLWIFLSSQMLRTFNLLFLIILFLLDFASLVFIYWRLFQSSAAGLIDFFIVTSLFLLVTYGLLYFRKTGTSKNNYNSPE